MAPGAAIASMLFFLSTAPVLLYLLFQEEAILDYNQAYNTAIIRTYCSLSSCHLTKTLCDDTLCYFYSCGLSVLGINGSCKTRVKVSGPDEIPSRAPCYQNTLTGEISLTKLQELPVDPLFLFFLFFLIGILLIITISIVLRDYDEGRKEEMKLKEYSSNA